MDRMIANVAHELEEMETDVNLMATRLRRLRKMLEESGTPELPGGEEQLPAESASLPSATVAPRAKMAAPVSCRKCGDYFHDGITGRNELCDKCWKKTER